jgi:hypothetical protein
MTRESIWILHHAANPTQALTRGRHDPRWHLGFQSVDLHSARQRAVQREFDGAIIGTGISVAAVWVVQIVTGRWRPGAHAFDRLGRCVGALWFVVGAVFAARLLLN